MTSPLDDLLTATAARIRRRELAVAGLWSLTSVAGLGLLGALVAGETLRGELVAPVAVTLAAGSAAVLSHIDAQGGNSRSEKVKLVAKIHG